MESANENFSNIDRKYHISIFDPTSGKKKEFFISYHHEDESFEDLINQIENFFEDDESNV